MAEVSISPDVLTYLAGLNGGIAWNTSVADNTGYLRPADAMYTPQGQAYIDSLVDAYTKGAGGGWNPDGTALNGSNYGLPGGTNGDPNMLRQVLMQGAMGQGSTAGWVSSQGQMPAVPSFARDMNDKADKLARDLQAAKDATDRYVVDTNAQLQRDLQAGLITHQAAMQASQEAHEKAMQAADLAFRYADLEWEKEYGRENLNILHDRLDLDREISAWQKANDERRVAVEEGRLGLERDEFGLKKAMEEAQMRANPFNAVANTLYMRGQQPGGGTNEFGAPLTTLDNSGVLPFLQELQRGGIQNPVQFGNSPLNQQGIGGNQAPAPNQISQSSFGNMSDTERGVTSSLAAYQGYNPQDYWQNMQRSWNTARQGGLNFATRLG